MKKMFLVGLVVLLLTACSKHTVEDYVSPTPAQDIVQTEKPAVPAGTDIRSGTMEAYQKSTIETANVRPEAVVLIKENFADEKETEFVKRVIFVESHYCYSLQELKALLEREGYDDYIDRVDEFVTVDSAKIAIGRAEEAMTEEGFAEEGLQNFLVYAGFSDSDVASAIAHCKENGLFD